MKTKEAIEFIEEVINIGIPVIQGEKIKFRKIIELLKRGEKFENMPNPFIAGFNITVEKERRDLISLIAEGNWYKTIVGMIKYELDTPKAILINGEDIRNRIKELEQKYFPKEVK